MSRQDTEGHLGFGEQVASYTHYLKVGNVSKKQSSVDIFKMLEVTLMSNFPLLETFTEYPPKGNWEGASLWHTKTGFGWCLLSMLL